MARISVFVISSEVWVDVPHMDFFFQTNDDEDLIVSNRNAITGMVERRKGYDPRSAYLVLHPTETYTINFKG